MAEAPIRKYQGVDVQSSGFRLLAAMGWREGEGLGLNKQGIKSHLRVKKKQDNQGIGVDESDKRNQEWTTGMLAFDSILARLNVAVSGGGAAGQPAPRKAKKRKREAAEAGEPPAGDTPEAPAAAKPSLEKKKRRKGSVKQREEAACRVEAPAAAEPRRKASRRKAGAEGGPEGPAALPADTAVPAGAQEGGSATKKRKKQGGAPPAEAAAQPVSAVKEAPSKGACHTARFARRRAGKQVGQYSSTDLAAILGSAAAVSSTPAPPVPAPTPAAPEPPRPSKRRRKAEQSASDASADTRLEAEAHEAAGSRPQPDAAPAAARAAEPSPAPPPVKRWWAKTFVSRGPLEGLADPPKAAEAREGGFREEDQTALYSAAHATCTAQRQGLGTRGLPKKVGGVRWEGSRTLIEDEEEAEQGAAAAPEVQGAQPAEGDQQQRQKKKKRSKQAGS